MQAVQLPASAGWRWVSQGLMIFMYKPAPIFAWAMAVMLLLMLASMLPPIGPLAFIVLFPTLSFLSFMVCRIAIGSRAVTAKNWQQWLHRPGTLRELCWMGVWYAMLNISAALAVLWPVVSSLPEATLETVMATQNLQPLLDALHGPLILLVVISVLLGAFFWYAPPLVGFCGLPAGRAMFYSAVACWRNKSAFVVYVLLVAALYWAVGQAMTLLLALGVPTGILAMVQIPVHVAVASVVYCSMLASFGDVFDESPSVPGELAGELKAHPPQPPPPQP